MKDWQHHTLTGDFRLFKGFQSKYLTRPRELLIYLPPGYKARPNRRYPVLYLQDGQNLFDGATSYMQGQEWRVDETAEKLIRTGEIEPLIIVGIYNTGDHRIDEYTPTTDHRRARGGKAHLYAAMLTRELKPFVDHEFRTRRGPQNTGLGGSSLGGLLTLTIGLQLPHVFGKLAVMSPSLWWDNELALQRARAVERQAAAQNLARYGYRGRRGLRPARARFARRFRSERLGRKGSICSTGRLRALVTANPLGPPAWRRS